MTAALAGLRVLDASDESGRLAGRLLAELGADVVRVRRGAAGGPLPGAIGARGGVLDWWYDGGTRRVALDLDMAEGRAAFADLAARCDVLIETERPGRLAALGLDHSTLAAANPRLVHVSLTPFGATGPRTQWQASDLVASALGGVLSVSGTEDAPLNGWGRQSFNIGGVYAAISALVALRVARTERRAVHVDLSLQQCVTSCIEQVLMYWFFPQTFPERLAGRHGALHWTRVYDVVPCATGHAMVTPAPHAGRLFKWMAEDGMLGAIADNPPRNAAELFARSDEIMAAIRAWAATKPASEVFAGGQLRRLPFGDVQSVREAIANPQLAARGFLRDVAIDDATARVPGPLFRLHDAPPAPASPPPADTDSTGAILASWPSRAPERAADADTGRAQSAARKPLAGLRVVDFTWVLAGPKTTRVLGDLGADVVKLQTEIRSQGTGHNDHPFFAMWNRSKRSATLDMKHERAVEIVRRLVEQADVVIDNFAPGVLDRWGIGYETLSSWNERIVYLSLSGCGQDGPWRDHVTFAPTIHALCGLTALTNPPGRRDVGHGISISDHLSGLAGAFAILATLDVRERTGRGQRIDLSQLEVGAYLVGPALLELASGGREAVAQGNRDGLDDLVPNEVYRCADGRWLAVSARDDADWQRLCEAVGDTTIAAELRSLDVAGRRARRGEIDAALTTWASARDADAAMQLLQESGVPAGAVQDARDLVERDPQLAARRAFLTLPHASLGTQSIECFPGVISGIDLDPYLASPAFGEHTFEVYGELLGMSEEEIALAIADGVFA
jgi:crotonobetainyl-CoA:carnitine CoA-transferase CaiB-like acyl-CoA transferase